MLLLSLIPAGRAFAQSGGTVVADGLLYPVGIAAGDDGSIYVAEGGSGGPEQIGSGDTAATRGYTSQITRIAPGGARSVAAANLPSTADAESSFGVGAIAYANGYLWALESPPSEGITMLPGEGALLRIDPSTGISTTVANVAAFETQHNPDPNALESNPYGLVAGPDGMVYVADAAGNDILKVNPNSGEVSLVAVIPGIALPAEMAPPGGNPARGGENAIDPVPTGLDFGSDGALYVSLLSGGPFPTGAAKIERVTLGGQVSDAAGGLTMLTDIKHGADGNWYVVQLAEFDPTSDTGFKPNSGAIWRVTPSGEKQQVAGGLFFPNKIAFDKSGNLYATVGTVTPAGMVMKWDNVLSTGGAAPGMPRTGEPTPVDFLAYAGMLMLLLGLAVRLGAPRLVALRNR